MHTSQDIRGQPLIATLRNYLFFGELMLRIKVNSLQRVLDISVIPFRRRHFGDGTFRRWWWEMFCTKKVGFWNTVDLPYNVTFKGQRKNVAID